MRSGKELDFRNWARGPGPADLQAATNFIQIKVSHTAFGPELQRTRGWIRLRSIMSGIVDGLEIMQNCPVSQSDEICVRIWEKLITVTLKRKAGSLHLPVST